MILRNLKGQANEKDFHLSTPRSPTLALHSCSPCLYRFEALPLLNVLISSQEERDKATRFLRIIENLFLLLEAELGVELVGQIDINFSQLTVTIHSNLGRLFEEMDKVFDFSSGECDCLFLFHNSIDNLIFKGTRQLERVETEGRVLRLLCYVHSAPASRSTAPSPIRATRSVVEDSVSICF